MSNVDMNNMSLIFPASTNLVIILSLDIKNFNDFEKVEKLINSTYSKQELIDYWKVRNQINQDLNLPNTKEIEFEDLGGIILGCGLHVKIWDTLLDNRKYVWRISSTIGFSTTETKTLKEFFNKTFNEPDMILMVNKHFTFQRIKEDLLSLYND